MREEIARLGFKVFENFFSLEECREQVNALDELSGTRSTKSLVMHRVFDALICEDRLVKLARELLGDNILFHHANGRSLASDFASKSWHHDRDGSRAGISVDMIHLMIYPAGLSLDCGPLIVLPGSHRMSVARSFPTRYGTKRLPGQIAITGRPGLLVVMDSALWHMRPQALKPQARWYFNISYCQRGIERPERQSIEHTLQQLERSLGPQVRWLLQSD